MEWIIPVGRAERAGDREGEGDVQTGILTRERKKRAIKACVRPSGAASLLEASQLTPSG